MSEIDWQTRLKLAGLTQRQLARLCGVTANTLSRQLSGEFSTGFPQYARTIVLIWERLGPDAKAEILAGLDQ